MSTQPRATPVVAPYLPGDEHRIVVYRTGMAVPAAGTSEPCEVPASLSSDLADRVDIWRAKRGISMSEAIERLIEVGLGQFQKPTRRGPKDYWGEARYLELHLQVSQIRAELQAGRKSKVSIPEAVEILRKRRPKLWKNAPSSLETKFYEADRKLKAHRSAYGPLFKDKD